MICKNCGKKIPERARSCKYCEAQVDDSPEIKAADFEEMLSKAGFSAETMGELKELAEKAGTAEEFADVIFVGDCPKCGSSNVGNCEKTHGIEDVTVARCFKCGTFWCAECGYELSGKEPKCPHWEICDECGKEEDCPHLGDPLECPELGEWMESVGLVSTMDEMEDDDGERNPDGDDN